MASIKDLKKRITTVKNTQQTTRAMKMVSAAKLRRAQEAILAQRPYARKLGGLIRHVATVPGASVASPLLESVALSEGAESAASAPRKILLVLVTSDRGLCGGFNGNVIKGAQRFLKSARAKGDEVAFAFVGKRGFDFFKMKTDITHAGYFSELAGKVTYAKASGLAKTLVSRFLAGEFTEIHVIFNEFKNAVSQNLLTEQFLPLAAVKAEPSAGEVHAWSAPAIIKENPRAVFESLLSKHFATQAFRILLESQASEHGARMSAMENATKNAGEMIKRLTLQYNKQRQAGITKELLEIISGSESQKQA